MNLKGLASRITGSGVVWMMALLAAVLVALMGGAWLPGQTLFSNDGPLGALMEACHRLPARFTGCWQDLNSIGYREESAQVSLTFGLQWLLGPLCFSKLYAPLALLLLGVSAWFCFRQFRLAQPACILGGLAATLVSTSFSSACWGVAAHAITVAMCFLALAALQGLSGPMRWVRAVLAGLALGMAVTEGADIGAIFSMLVAAFVIWQALVAEGPRARNLGAGVLRLVLVTVCAAFLAADTVLELFETNVEKVVASANQDTQTPQGHWDWATQWSLPKRETLGFIVPGLFGYRLDTQNGGAYWGGVGRDPAWYGWLVSDRRGPRPVGFLRFAGGGNYLGIPVALLAVWATAQALRRKGSVFSPVRRRLLWFWIACGIVSLLLAFGRHAPFYRWLYALPYFSTIRNPVKFVHIFSLAAVVLFAFGCDSLWRAYLQPPAAPGGGRWPGFGRWWKNVAGFDRLWVRGCVLVLLLGLVGWAVYALYGINFLRPQLQPVLNLLGWNSDPEAPAPLEQYLESVLFAPEIAQSIALFSVGQVGWFVLFFVLTAALVVLLLSGAFTGPRASWGAVLLGAVLAADLGRSDQYWVRIWDIAKKYDSNPIVDRLYEQAYEHRVADIPRDFLEPELAHSASQQSKALQADLLLYQVFTTGWGPHLFHYHNVQALDILQLPRKPEDLKAFEEALTSHAATDAQKAAETPALLLRRWQLTNTRYILGTQHFLDYMARCLGPGRQPLRVAERFDFVPRPGVPRFFSVEDLMAVTRPNGVYLLCEFPGALPRARLYAYWQVLTNRAATLKLIASPAFDPEQCVLVGEDLPAGAAPPATNQPAGTVEFVSYAPKRIVLKANATAPALLLLNDRFDPDWRVQVDGQPAKLLRCNAVMRGVYLTPGAHDVAFRFMPRVRALYVSAGALGFGLLLLGLVTVSAIRRPPEATPPRNASPAAAPPAATTRPQTPRRQGGRKDRRNGNRPNGNRPNANSGPAKS